MVLFIAMKGVFIMAINETIVTGRKFRKLIDEVNKIWQRISFWTKAVDVEFNDGKTAETKIGAINGVTDSLTSTASNVAASAKAVKTLNDKITQINSNLNDAIYNAIVAQGVTPASKNYADLVAAIAAVKTNNYNSGVATGINSMAIRAVGGANTGTFTITNYAYCTKAYLVVEVVDDDRRSYASVIVPGGGCTEIHNLEYGQHDCYTNMQVFELTGLPAGTITINCALGYGRCAVLIGA